MGAQASNDQYEKIQSYLKLGKEEGAELLCGGDINKLDEDLAGGYYIQPTLFKGHNKMRIFQEEIFGPVVCVTTFKTTEEAIAIANDTLYGLGTGANNTKLVATYVDSSKISGSGDWPLLQDSTSYTDVGDLQLLKDLTLGQGNAVSYPPTTVQVVIPTYVDPYYGSYSVGDEVRLNVHDDFTPNGLDLIMRIVAIDVSPGEQSPDRVTVTLTRQLASGSVS